MEEQDFENLFQKYIDKYANDNLFRLSAIPAHQHTGLDSLLIDWNSLNNKQDFFVYRILDKTTNITVSSSIGGNYVMPYDGYFLDIGATIDSSTGSGTLVIDILKNGTSILNTKIQLLTTSTTSRDGIQAIFNDKKFKTGDIITVDVTSTPSPRGNGLSIFMNTVITGGV